METLDTIVEFLQNYQEYSLAMIFGMLILCGFGLPIPEDITLIAAGILSGIQVNTTHGHFVLMLCFCLAGVLIGDGIMFIGGRLFGYKLQKYTPLRKVLPPSRFAWVQRQFRKYGVWALFFARFMPGLRAPIYLAAGMSRRVSYLKFLLLDGAAALISVPVWVGMGHYGAQNRDNLARWMSNGHNITLVVIGVVILAVVILVIRNRKKAKKEKQNEAQNAGEESTDAKKEA